MKRRSVPCWFAVILLSVIAYSCQKDETQGPVGPTGPTGPVGGSPGSIQKQWFLVNIIVYGNPALTGPSFFGMAGNGLDQFDFRADGKLYAFMLNSFDTAAYNLLPDSTLLLYDINGGIQSTKADSAKIRKLTNDSLIFVVRNPANDYGKFTFRK